MIFVDAWAWVALAVQRDQYHALAKSQHQKLRQARRKYVTTEYVVNEAINYLYRVGPAAKALGYINALLAKADAGDYHLVHDSSDQFRRAWQLRQKYHDKPDISFVDFTSFVVMQDLGIAELTEHRRDSGGDSLDNDFTLQEFLDKFGMRLAQLGTILNLVAPLAEAGSS